jgi:hypothetical protein
MATLKDLTPGKLVLTDGPPEQSIFGQKMPTTIVDTLLELQELYGAELVKLSKESDHWLLELKLPSQLKASNVS